MCIIFRKKWIFHKCFIFQKKNTTKDCMIQSNLSSVKSIKGVQFNFAKISFLSCFEKITSLTIVYKQNSYSTWRSKIYSYSTFSLKNNRYCLFILKYSQSNGINIKGSKHVYLKKYCYEKNKSNSIFPWNHKFYSLSFILCNVYDTTLRNNIDIMAQTN